jgi:hypothetical protein
VTAWTNDGSSSAAPPVVATLSPPLLTFSAHPLGPLDLDAQAELDWQVDYGIQAFIAPPPQGGLGQVNPKGTLSFAPGTFLQGNADAVTFSLRATGYKPPPPDTVTFTFNPAEILSFTYEDLASKVPRYVKRNGFAQLVEKDGLYTLTVTGPGGPLVQYLGPGPYLQVQYFAASPDPAPSGGPVTLQWVTLNAASLELQDGVSSKPLTPVAQGTTQVTPTADTTYVLVATAADGQQVTSQLTVTVAS